jgi:hypothetical protein
MGNKLFNPVSNIIHECVKLVGVADTILCLQRVVGTFMIEGIDTSEELEDIHVMQDHRNAVQALEAVRYHRSVKMIDGRREDDTK